MSMSRGLWLHSRNTCIFTDHVCMLNSTVSRLRSFRTFFLIFFFHFSIYTRADFGMRILHIDEGNHDESCSSCFFLPFLTAIQNTAYRRRFILAHVSLVSKAVQYNTEKQLRRARDNRINESETWVCFVLFFIYSRSPKSRLFTRQTPIYCDRVFLRC